MKVLQWEILRKRSGDAARKLAAIVRAGAGHSSVGGQAHEEYVYAHKQLRDWEDKQLNPKDATKN